MPSLDNSQVRRLINNLQEISSKLRHPSLTNTLEIQTETSGPNVQIIFIEEFTPGGSLKYIRERLNRQGVHPDNFV